MKTIKFSIAALCLCVLTVSTRAQAKITHSVVGSAVEQQQIAPFGEPVTITVRLTVAAFEDTQGNTWGDLVSTIDLRPLGLGRVTFNAKVDCLTVQGNKAWISSTVTESTNPFIFPIGDTGISFIEDLGGNGQDLMFGEEADAFPPGTTCADKPEMPAIVVSNGNYTVR